jgi:lipopolysaccharide export LptBFGC system permease protein LptF
MLFTLQKYVFHELLKVFLPAVVALTLILSLGSVLQPVQEYGVGPKQAVHLMGYFLPITLTFVLPIAALFAGALVYGRFAGDNELDACKASGISILTLAHSGLALALIVAAANLALSFYVTPLFVRLAEKSLKADAKQILFRNLQRRGYYKLELPTEDYYRIYADYVDPENDTLAGVVVAEVRSGRIEKITATDSANVSFHARNASNYVQITARHTYQLGPPGEGGWAHESERLPITKEFGSLLGDDIAFKKLSEMKEIRADLMRFNPIAERARKAYAQLVTELLVQDITSHLSGETDNFYRLHSDDKVVEFSAGQCALKAEKTVELSGEIVVVEYDAHTMERLRTLRSASASLHVMGDELAPSLTLDIRSARIEDSGELKMRHVIRGLELPQDLKNTLGQVRPLQNVRPESVSSVLQDGPSSTLSRFQSALDRTIRDVLVEIKAEIHSRLAFGVGCVPMILIGIGLGVIKRGGHVLSAFGASCVPAAVLIVCIISGKRLTENLGSRAISGVILMWSGFVVLSVLTVVLYRRLMKN